MSGQSHVLAALPAGMQLLVPSNRMLGGPQSRVWTLRSKEKSIIRAGDGTAGRPAQSPVTKPTELPRMPIELFPVLRGACDETLLRKIYGRSKISDME